MMKRICPWAKNHLAGLVIAGLVLDLGISGILFAQNQEIQKTQHVQGKLLGGAVCWDEVLVVALHDHLTAPQRAGLLKIANHCADITEPRGMQQK